MRLTLRLGALIVAVTLAVACARADVAPDAAASTAVVSTASSSTTLSSTTQAPTTASTVTSTTTPTTEAPTSAPETTAPTSTEAPAPATIPIRIRLDRRVSDEATAGFADLVGAVLTDERGWSRAGFEFVVGTGDAASAADYTVVLAEGSEVDQLCLPYDTGGRFSCQIGPVVALNADRWRTAVESWPGSLDEYRTMLVNHEVGHLIGQHHPAERCPGDGQPAPVMAQQSSGVAPCTANPWPLDWEIECASLGLEPLAPPFERDIELTCGPDGPLN